MDVNAAEGERLAEIRFPSRPDRLKLVRSVVHDAAKMCGCSGGSTDDVVIAVNEACMNVIQHAYAGDPKGEIVLEIRRKGNQLVFRLQDFAAPVDVSRIKPRKLEEVRPGGLGVNFICEVMDETQFLPPPGGAGNLLRMVKRID